MCGRETGDDREVKKQRRSNSGANFGANLFPQGERKCKVTIPTKKLHPNDAIFSLCIKLL